MAKAGRRQLVVLTLFTAVVSAVVLGKTAYVAEAPGGAMQTTMSDALQDQSITRVALMTDISMGLPGKVHLMRCVA